MQSESLRLVPGAKTAVLFLHGICSSANQFRKVLPLEQVVPETVSFHNILLPGHGGSVRDFAGSSMRQWREHVHAAFDRLAQTHEQVILVGHSMGTLFSVELALTRPEKVASLLLIEVPLRVGIKIFGVRNLLRWSRGKTDQADPIQASMTQAVGIKPAPMLGTYLSMIPRFWELLCLMHRTARRVKQLRQKTIAWQSPIDELVSNRSAKILKRSGRVQVRSFQHSTHLYFHPQEILWVQEDLRMLLSSEEK